MIQYVYILSNPSLPSLYKIGYTANSIEERMEQLYSTGVPTKFELEFCIEVANGLGTEQHFHKLFSQFHHGKEFFKLPLAKLIKILKEELFKGEIDFINYYGRANRLYLEDDEIRKIKEEIEKNKKLKADKKRKEDEEKREREKRLQREKERLNFLSKTIEYNTTKLIKIILVNSTYFNGNIITRFKHINHYKDGLQIGKKINADEILLAKQLKDAITEFEKLGIIKERINTIFKDSSKRIELVLDVHKFTFADNKNVRHNVIRFDGLSPFAKGIIDSAINQLD